MNAAGQVLIEYLLLASIFLLLIGVIAPKIPVTFSQATPSLGGKVEQRLQTGSGFVDGDDWKKPVRPKGGARD